MKSEVKRFIAVVRFDSPTWEEFQKILCGMLESGVSVEVLPEPNSNLYPEYSRWQLILTSTNWSVKDE